MVQLPADAGGSWLLFRSSGAQSLAFADAKKEGCYLNRVVRLGPAAADAGKAGCNYKVVVHQILSLLNQNNSSKLR